MPLFQRPGPDLLIRQIVNRFLQRSRRLVERDGDGVLPRAVVRFLRFLLPNGHYLSFLCVHRRVGPVGHLILYSDPKRIIVLIYSGGTGCNHMRDIFGTFKAMSYRREHLELTDEELLRQCDVHIYRSSGPGGQHRNKVSSAVRLKHRPTGVTTHGDESRSQHENKRMAVRRVRMEIACRIRHQIDRESPQLPAVVSECIFRPRGKPADAPLRLEVGRKDRRFWTVAGFLLDVLEGFEGHLADAGAYIGITTGNLSTLLKSHRRLLSAAQAIRKRFNLRPLN